MTELDTIGKRVAYLEGAIEQLEQFAREYTRDQFLQKPKVTLLIERALHLALESALDLVDMLINTYRLRKAETYRHGVRYIQEAKIISYEFSKKLEELAGFRNILVHGYIELDPEKVYTHWREDPTILREFIAAVKQYLKKHPPA